MAIDDAELARMREIVAVYELKPSPLADACAVLLEAVENLQGEVARLSAPHDDEDDDEPDSEVSPEEAARRAAAWEELRAYRHPICQDLPVNVDLSVTTIIPRGLSGGCSSLNSFELQVKTDADVWRMRRELQAVFDRYAPGMVTLETRSEREEPAEEALARRVVVSVRDARGALRLESGDEATAEETLRGVMRAQADPVLAGASPGEVMDSLIMLAQLGDIGSACSGCGAVVVFPEGASSPSGMLLPFENAGAVFAVRFPCPECGQACELTTFVRSDRDWKAYLATKGKDDGGEHARGGRSAQGERPQGGAVLSPAANGAGGDPASPSGGSESASHLARPAGGSPHALGGADATSSTILEGDLAAASHAELLAEVRRHRDGIARVAWEQYDRAVKAARQDDCEAAVAYRESSHLTAKLLVGA